MTLDEVIANLECTIEGKQKLLDELANRGPFADPIRNMVTKATADFLRVNLTELNNIRDHLLLVKGTVAKAEAKAVEDSWKTNPDRMGGCYTFEEIAESRGWI